MRVMLGIGHQGAAAAAAAILPLLLASCGGSGGGMYGMGMGMGMSMSCMSGMDGNGNPCMPPTVTMNSPGPTVHLTVTLSATAMGDSVRRVDFMVDGAPVGTAMTAPFRVQWDSTTVTDGKHTLTASAMDGAGQTVMSAPVSVSVENVPTFTVPMAASQMVPATPSSASGSAVLTAKLASGALSGKVMLSGISATGVSLNEAFAGDSGAAVIRLTANGGNAGEWDVPAGALLTADQVGALLQGKFYVIAMSAADPGGEIRGQIAPSNIMVIFSAMSGTQEVPPVSISASGVAATTVDATAHTLSVHVHAIGVDDAMSAEVASGAMGATGARLAALAKDGVDHGHWAIEFAPVSEADLANFDASRWYANLATPTDPAGAIRGQLQVPNH